MTDSSLARDPGECDPAVRIVSLAPSTTEILFGIGAGDRLVGVSRYCDFPTEVATLPKVSRFTDADDEAIVALRPDLVVTSSYLQRAIVDRLIERDVTVLALNPVSLKGVFRDMLLLGRVVGAFGGARAQVSAMRDRVTAVSAQGAALPYHPRVYLEEWGKPLITGGWWMADFLELAGGRSIWPDLDPHRRANERIVTPEAVRAADPDAMILAWPGVRKDVVRRRALTRPEWREMIAVCHGRVHAIDDYLLHRPGPRMVDGLEAVARIVQQVSETIVAERSGKAGVDSRGR